MLEIDIEYLKQEKYEFNKKVLEELKLGNIEKAKRLLKRDIDIIVKDWTIEENPYLQYI